VLAIVYWVGTTVYNQYIASEYNVRLPFVDEYEKDLYITNINAAKDPTFDQLLTFLEKDDTETFVIEHPSLAFGTGIVRLHNNAEKAGIRGGVAELRLPGESDVYALNVFNTVDKGQIMVDCSGDPYEVGEEYIVHMDNKDLHTMMFIPIENTSRDFLADTDDVADDDEYITLEARINSYTW
jgi:hypothetical protein